MPNAEFRYPNTASPSTTYTPSNQPDIGSRLGPDPGIMQEILGDGSRRSKRSYDPVERFSRIFERLTATDIVNREAFIEAVAGRQFGYRDEILVDWTPVQFTGESLVPQSWETQGAGFYRRIEEFVGVPVPTVDALGAIRKGRLTITGSATEGAILFSSAFNNIIYNFTYGVSASSASVPMLMVREKAGRTQSGLTMELSGSPGAGNSIYIDYLAVE